MHQSLCLSILNKKTEELSIQELYEPWKYIMGIVHFVNSLDEKDATTNVT